MNRLKIGLAFLLIAAIAFTRHAAWAQEKSKPTQLPIPELISRLDSAKYREREMAQQALLARDEAYPHLRRSLSTLSAEGQIRARAILEVLEQRRSKQFLQYGREGRVDVLVEWSGIAGAKLGPGAFGQCVLDIAWGVLSRSKTETGTQEWKDFPSRRVAEFFRDRAPYFDEAEVLMTAQLPYGLAVQSKSALKSEFVKNCILVTTDSVHIDVMLSNSIVYSLGDITNAGLGDHNVLVSDGDMSVLRDRDVVKIARGSVLSESGPISRYRSPRKIALEKEELAKSQIQEPPQYDLLYRPGEPARRIFVPPHAKESSSAAKVDEPPPPRKDGIRFFEVSDIGLALIPSNGAPGVVSVRAKSPLAVAGVKSGDAILVIDGDDIHDVNSARRLLRRSFVAGSAKLTILRDGRILDVDVSFFNWKLPSDKAATEK